MKKLIMILPIIGIITFSYAIPSSAKSSIYSTTTATVKNVNGKNNTLKVVQTGHDNSSKQLSKFDYTSSLLVGDKGTG